MNPTLIRFLKRALGLVVSEGSRDKNAASEARACNAICLPWKPESSLQRDKARIGTNRVELWFHCHENHPVRPVRKCFLKESERLLFFSQSYVDDREVIRRDILVFAGCLQLRKQLLGLRSLTRSSIGVSQRCEHQRRAMGQINCLA